MFSACTQQEEQKNTIARVNNEVLTDDMVRQQMDSTTMLKPALVQQYANRWITNELLYQEAKRQGIHTSEDVEQRVEEARKQLSISALLEREVYRSPSAVIPQNVIASYFQAHQDEFRLQEQTIWLSLAVFSNSSMANEFRASALGTTGWEQSVKLFQSDTSKQMIAYTDSLFYTQSSLYPPELWKVAAITGRLEVSFPIKTSAGYFVLRSLGNFAANTIAPLKKVRQTIVQRLEMEQRQQRYAEYLETLRKQNNVQLFLSPSDSQSQ